MNQIGKEEILNLVEYYKFKSPCDVKILIDLIICTAEGCMRGREDLDIVKTQEIVTEFKCMISYDFIQNENKPTIVLIHGYGVNRKMWQPQLDFFE
jgi:pimeloyl-ACP methyl ester carboxylesterase